MKSNLGPKKKEAPSPKGVIPDQNQGTLNSINKDTQESLFQLLLPDDHPLKKLYRDIDFDHDSDMVRESSLDDVAFNDLPIEGLIVVCRIAPKNSKIRNVLLEKIKAAKAESSFWEQCIEEYGLLDDEELYKIVMRKVLTS